MGDDDENAEPALPLHQWPDPQLARAFRTWAASPRTGEPLHWLLRSATAGAHPAWMGRERTTPVLLAATDVTEALAVSLDDLLWLAPEHAHWRERQEGGHALPLSHYRYRLLPKPSGGLRLLEALAAALAYGLSPLALVWGRISVSDALLAGCLGFSLLLSWR